MSSGLWRNDNRRVVSGMGMSVKRRVFRRPTKASIQQDKKEMLASHRLDSVT